MGIEPVPERLRVLGLVDTTLLWTNLGISLLVLVLPAYFDLLAEAGALRRRSSAALIGNSMLARGRADRRGRARAGDGAPAGAARAAAARTSRPCSTSLQCLGWAIFELIVIATAAGLLCDQLFGFKATWVVEARLRRASPPRSRCSGRSASCAASCASSRSGPSLASVVYLGLVDRRRREPRQRSGRDRARTTARSGSRSTRWSRSRSRGRRSSPTTRASRATGAARSSASGSATSCRRCSSSASARSSCSRAGVDPNHPS